MAKKEQPFDLTQPQLGDMRKRASDMQPEYDPRGDIEMQKQGEIEQPGLPNMYRNYMRGDAPSLFLSGTPQEQYGALSGLNLANILYGQNIAETGQDVSKLRETYQQRAFGGADPVSEAIRSAKSGAMATAGREMRAAGVKGPAAAMAAEAIGRQRDADVAASLYGQQRQSLGDLKSLTGNTIAGSVALMQGSKGEAIQMPQAPQPTGMFGTVICTELHRQGLMPTETYLKDSAYGKTLPQEVIAGYQFWAIPVVNLMRKSPIITAVIKPLALSWAKHIAGEKKSLFGYMCQIIGEPICGVIGSIIKTRNIYV